MEIWTKSIKSTALAAAFAVAAPFAASAATVTSHGVTGGCESSLAGGVGQIDVLAGATWDSEFDLGDAAGACLFNLTNSSATAVAATVSVATVNQFGLSTGANTWGFEDGVNLSGVVNWSLAEGEGGLRTFHFNIAAGDTVFFDWSWGDVYGTATQNPDIDFVIGATSIPVPAAGLLLLTALGGMGVASRRRKKA